MKKRLFSLLLVVALMCQMIAGTALAANTSKDTAGDLSAQMTKTAEYYSEKVLANLSNEAITDTMIAQSYEPVFLLGASGVKSETITALNSKFVKAVNALIAKDGKILSSSSVEDPVLYAGIISALTVIGENPKEIGGKNLLTLFEASMEASWHSYGWWIELAGSPYNLGYVISVLNNYKADITSAAEALPAVITKATGYYYADGKTDVKYISESTDDDYAASLGGVFDESVATVLAGFEKGTSLDDIKKYTIDTYGYIRVPNPETDSDVFDALTPLVSDAGRTLGTEASYDGKGYYITITDVFTGTGVFYYGFSADNDAKFLTFLNGQEGTDEKVAAIKTALAQFVTEDGTVKYDATYGPNADSTGLALSAYSILGDAANAAKVYAGLKTYINKENGAVQYYGEDSMYATRDGFEGLVSYYRFIANEGSIYNLKAATLAGKAAEAYEMKKEEGASTDIVWMQDAKEGLTFTSPADITKFVAVLVDDKKVDDKYITLKEGSTIVTIAPEYLATLDAGKHTIKIQSTDGYAVADFAIQTKEAVPNTGDNFNLMMIVVFAMAGLMGIALIQKRRYNA